MFVTDAHTLRAQAWLPNAADRLTLSDWTLTEFTSALGTVHRVGRMTAAERDAAERALDQWVQRRSGVLAVSPEDVRRARDLMRSTAEPLRAPDALHLAIVQRSGASLASFDGGMRRAAADLGLVLEPL
jgi:predicted nucleic acid-binding protein